MLMADDRSEPMGFDGSTFVEDDDGLTLDLNLFWEIMAEDNNSDPPEQNSPEDLSEGKQQNVNLSSDAGNGEAENSQQMGLMQPERTMPSWEQFWGPDALIPSYNSEASDLGVGISQGSFNSGANSVTPDYVKQDASTTQFGSPMHSCSESLTDWMSQVPRYDSFGAGSKNVIQNFTSFSTDDSKRTQYEQPNCTDSFSFPAGAVNSHSEFTANLGSGDLKPEAVFQFMCPQGHSNTQYGEHSTFLGNPDINYQQFCGSEPNSFQTLVPQDLLDTSMIDMNMTIPWDLDGNCNIKKDEGVTGILDEMTDFPTQFSRINGLITPDVQVGESGQSVVPLSGTPTFSGRILKRENDNLVLRRGGMSLSKAGKTHTIDRRSMVYKQANVTQLNQVKDENRDEQVLSQAKTSLSISHSMNTNGICKGFTAEKRARPLLPRSILPSSSSEKLFIHIKDEKDLFKESKRARLTLCNDEDKKVNLVVDDRCSDVQVSEQPCIQPFSSMKQLDCKEDEGDSKLIQRSSIDTQNSKASCRTVHTTAIVNSFDDDADVCIIENLSDPSRASRPINTKHVASHAAVSDSVSHMGMGGTKFRANDERLIFRAVVQDLSQPKTEANPPDGLLAVPLLRHQRIALSWMVQKETASLYCSGGILADDQGLGKTISTIALILKERAPSSKNSPDDVKTCERETLNLDDDDDCESEVIQLKQNDASCSAVSDGTSIRSRDYHVEAKGRPAAGTLVVCPTSVLRQWADELHNKVTREANLSVLIYHGGSRTKDHLELTKYDVVLTTYAIVSMEVPKQPLVDRDEDDRGRKEARIVPPLGLSSSKKRKYPPGSNKRSKKDKKGIESELLECTARPLAKVGWFRVILDEAQSIKNHRTQVARACWGLRAKRRWCLSGTPIQNAVDDLYSYFRFLRYDPYAVYKSFCSTIKVPINRNPTNGYKKLQAVLKTIMLRRTKGTFLDGEPIINLPPKTVELKKVVFSDEERDFYCRLESDSRAQFAEYAAAGTVKQNYVNILLMLLRLRQACDHPLLVKGYSSTSAWRSSVDMAKKLPREKQICLLNCLEASLALCGICNDPPEDAVVTSCGHVFCNQCICEHLTGDDNQCPTKNCKNRLSSSSVFSTDTLKCSLSEQPGQDDKSNCVVSRNSDKLDLSSLSQASDSSKIKAALEVLQSLSKPVRKTRTTTSSLTLLDESAPCQDTLCDSVVKGVELDVCHGEKSTLDESSSDTVQIVGEKAIVFSQWTRMLDLLESCLKDSSIQYRRLDGTMSVLARDKAVKDFNTIPEVSVMIMSLKAASLGLNMVAACHVILLDLWWNPTTEDQAVDRAHRIGQTRPVKVLRLTVKDTVEDRILALQQKKREMVASAFGEDEAGGRQTRLTVEDLKYLFMA